MFAVQNLIVALHSGNKTLEFVYLKYKCISESHIHHSRVQCSLER